MAHVAQVWRAMAHIRDLPVDLKDDVVRSLSEVYNQDYLDWDLCFVMAGKDKQN